MLKLYCFGPLELHGCHSTRVSSQHLLLLSYVCTEGPLPRWELASLFWPHLDGEYTKKGERKGLSNLGVLLANLRSACGLDLDDRAALTALPCDATEFQRLLAQGDPESALKLYARGPFLADIEHRPRLRLGTELESWLSAQRARYDGLARAALLGLAQSALAEGRTELALERAEQAARIRSPGEDFEVQAALASLLSELHSPLAVNVQGGLTGALAEVSVRLPPDAFRYYLLLALQHPPNPAAAQQAADLSTRDAARCREQLLETGLVTQQGSVQPALAVHHFAVHPLDKLTLLAALRDHTPPEQAAHLYGELYALSGHFGGIGYWARARQAYCLQARALMQTEAYAEAATLLEQFEQAERLNQQEPQPENRLLQAYALERLGQRRRALEVLAGVPDTAEVQAMRSALLVQLEDPRQADELAAGVLAGRYGEPSPFARALALNSLGQSAYTAGQYLQAERHFEQSAILWALAGQPKREIGGLMNRANALHQQGRHPEATQLYHDLLGRVGQEALRVRILLNLGYLAEQADDWQAARGHYQTAQTLGDALGLAQADAALSANILHNLGYAEHQLGAAPEARGHLNAAMTLALSAGDRGRYAIALGNLGMVERSPTKVEMALQLLQELGQHVYVRQYSALCEGLLHELLAETSGPERHEEHQLYQSQLDRLVGTWMAV